MFVVDTCDTLFSTENYASKKAIRNHEFWRERELHFSEMVQSAGYIDRLNLCMIKLTSLNCRTRIFERFFTGGIQEFSTALKFWRN